MHSKQVRVYTKPGIFGNVTLAYRVKAGGAEASGEYTLYINSPPSVSVGEPLVVKQTSPPVQLSSLLSAADVETPAASLVYKFVKSTLLGVSLWEYNGTAFKGPLSAGVATFTYVPICSIVLSLTVQIVLIE